MEPCQKAIHLRTGDRGTDGAISAWLERHGVEVVACADAFEACTIALTHSAAAPDLALIGADWLAPEELAISSYFRETWPELTVVIYGSASATAGFEATALTHVCRSAAAVRRMLAATPGALVEESRGALKTLATLDDGWRPQLDAPLATGAAAVEESALPRPATRMQATDAGVTPPDGEQPPATTAGQPAPASQTILTREELAALLEDEER